MPRGDEFSLKDGFLAVRPYPGDPITAKITDITGWTEISNGLKGAIQFALSATNTRLRPREGDGLGNLVEGESTGTVSFQVIRSRVANADSGLTAMEDAMPRGSKRFQFMFNPFRADLVNNAGNVVPNATAANPQHAGTIGLTSVDPYGPGGSQTVIVNVQADLDSDYEVYRA